MGIQDRDYMRQRDRDRARPFLPPRQGPSLLTIVVFWAAIAVLLYHAYDWWLLNRSKPRLSRADRVATATDLRGPVGHTPLPSPQQQRMPETPKPAAPVIDARPVQAIQPRPLQEPGPQANPAAPTGGTIYLCKAYNGGTFWAQAHCAQHQALIDSIVPVPAGLPFAQQVQLAEQRRQPAAQPAYATSVQASTSPAAAAKAQCQALDRQVEAWDAMARQPQSAQMQDWIRGQRQAARDRQFVLRC